MIVSCHSLISIFFLLSFIFFHQETKLPPIDTNKFTRQKDAVLNKLTAFEMTNQTLRRMLRDRHTEEADIQRLAEQKDILMRQLQSVEREKEVC